MKIKLLLIFFLLATYCADSKERGDDLIIDIDKNVKQVMLPSVLDEISGLAIDSLGRLFAHNDEIGVIYQLDTNDGKIVKKFQLGSIGIEGDFEGIAIAGKRFFLIESTGTLYEFLEGENNRAVSLKKYDLNFSSKYEIEGLCFDHELNALLIACKNYSGKKYINQRPVFLFSLKDNKLHSEPFFTIDTDQLKKEHDIKDFYPSGITKSPVSNEYYLVSAKGECALIVVSNKGKVLSANKLKKNLHQQPEGITFLNDGTMLICDEKVKKFATLTFYLNYNHKNGY